VLPFNYWHGSVTCDCDGQFGTSDVLSTLEFASFSCAAAEINYRMKWAE